MVGRTTSTASSKKHHKKHKKHKKKKTHHEHDIIDVVSDVLQVPSTSSKNITPILSTSSSSRIMTTPVLPTIATLTLNTSNTTKSQKRRKGKGKDSGTSSDEERWLDAIESGKLEEVDDELKKIKDPKLMTARQRAMYERNTDKELSPGGEMLMSLPIGYKEKVMTAEAIQKAQLKSQKRKQLADEKREKDKKKTMERLLKKQDSTKIGKQIKSKITKVSSPVISYRSNANENTITFPPNSEIPIQYKPQIDPPKIILCSIVGCTNIKKYNCSKTNAPLCSLVCYKHNIESLNNIMC